MNKISCLISDIIRYTLASCDYRDCDEKCMDYLLAVAHECPVAFNNEMYLRLWNTLFNICDEIGIQSSPFYLDDS